MAAFQFLKTAIKDHKVAAVTATSQAVVRRIVELLPEGSRCLLEYGPGDGAITRSLLAALPTDGRLVAFETNADFISALREIGDRRLTVVHADVREAMRDLSTFALPPADAIVSGIPFTLLRPEEREELVRHTARAIRPGGRFLVYQFSPLMVPVLRKHFAEVSIVFEPRNFPPYFIMCTEKPV
jgi:phospholipid N-methyltransferase